MRRPVFFGAVEIAALSIAIELLTFFENDQPRNPMPFVASVHPSMGRAAPSSFCN